MASHDEVPLLGGMSTPGVVQVGDTVRRPIGANSEYGFTLTEDTVLAGARLVRDVHDLTQGTPFAAGSEVAPTRICRSPTSSFAT